MRPDRHAQLAAMLEREARAAGRVPTTERAADALLGPLDYRAAFTERSRLRPKLGARILVDAPAAAAVVEAGRTTGFRVAEPSYTFE